MDYLGMHRARLVEIGLSNKPLFVKVYGEQYAPILLQCAPNFV
jgi:hypothetical protein